MLLSTALLRSTVLPPSLCNYLRLRHVFFFTGEQATAAFQNYLQVVDMFFQVHWVFSFWVKRKRCLGQWGLPGRLPPLPVGCSKRGIFLGYRSGRVASVGRCSQSRRRTPFTQLFGSPKPETVARCQREGREAGASLGTHLSMPRSEFPWFPLFTLHCLHCAFPGRCLGVARGCHPPPPHRRAAQSPSFAEAE